jgi:two-component system, NtrC family, nitrogen regulation sensor histidine kinase NtrY
VQRRSISEFWGRLNSWRKQRRVQSTFAFTLAVQGPLLVIATVLAMGRFSELFSGRGLRGLLLLDLIYVLVVASLVARRIVQMVLARRAKSAGSRLHMRLSGVFAFIALVPTVLVAVFATLTLNFGLEGWFSDRVRAVVGSSLSAAQAYESEQRDDLVADAKLLADYLDQQKAVMNFVSSAQLRQFLTQGQTRIQRGLKEAYLIDGGAGLRARGERSYLFDFEAPAASEIEQAASGETVVIQDWGNNEFRALVKLKGFVDRYLYVSREVDGQILSLLDDTKQTVALYNQMENERGRLLFDLGLIYLGFAMIVILAAIWMGLWFAERLARPVARLAGAVQRVGDGDLDVQVREEQGDDEIAMLGRVFNRMTTQVKGQRDDLIEANQTTERRRRLFDSVLSGVTAGVIGLNAEGKVALMNAAAASLLNLDRQQDLGRSISQAVPEFAGLFEQLDTRGSRVQQAEIHLTRDRSTEILLVRMASRLTDDGEIEGYVITFDDVTDLVSAQRTAAWGDVARRIAHEIKNPLTPIQLSADRLRRKFTPLVGDQAELLEQYTGVIIRQTEGLRRIVDEFSKFARMPEPERKPYNLNRLISDAVVLQQNAMDKIRITLQEDYPQIVANVDATMITQALINLIKNAAEAIESYREKSGDKDYQPEIRVVVEPMETVASIRIEDNGIGLPEQRSRLFEPYVTNRDNGTGLGLPIVKKIIEEHGGTLELLDAPLFEGGTHRGAMARIVLPITQCEQSDMDKEKVA